MVDARGSSISGSGWYGIVMLEVSEVALLWDRGMMYVSMAAYQEKK